MVIWATLLPLICPRGLYTPPYSKRIDRKLVCIVLAIFEMILLHAYTCGKSGAHVLKTLKWHYSGGGKIYEIFPFGTSLNKLIHTLKCLTQETTWTQNSSWHELQIGVFESLFVISCDLLALFLCDSCMSHVKFLHVNNEIQVLVASRMSLATIVDRIRSKFYIIKCYISSLLDRS